MHDAWTTCPECDAPIDADNPYSAAGVCSLACYMTGFVLPDQLDGGDRTPQIPAFTDDS